MPSDGPARCSRSAWSAGASVRSSPPATRSAAALGEFERLGAATWIEKARGEVGRIGGRTREEGLTAAERRVAALVAEGGTNKEVAAALLLGERTVETHLSHVYAKLGVRSRAELARRFPAGRARLRGTHDFKLSTTAYRRSGAELPRSRRSSLIAQRAGLEPLRASSERSRQQRRHSEIEIGLLVVLLGAVSFVRAGPVSAHRRRRQCAPAADYPAATTPIAFWSTEARLRDRPGRPWRPLRFGELRQQVPRRGGRVHGHRPRRDL
jgi:DNA-binding CsgD family transcriptional regulator